MRFAGKLTTWNAERGFGFITPAEGGQDVFVHISELPRGFKPSPDVALTFEVALNAQRKKKAVAVQLLKAPAAPARPPRSVKSSTGRRVLEAVTTLALVTGLGWVGYRHIAQPTPMQAPLPAARVAAPIAEPLPAPMPMPSRVYRCDGRLHCSQMTSCEEATWFLKNCPGTQMDGNHDGVPCEKKWCR